jgi:hypothetical protein
VWPRAASLPRFGRGALFAFPIQQIAETLSDYPLVLDEAAEEFANFLPFALLFAGACSRAKSE